MRIEANRNFYSQGSPVDALAVSIENECRELFENIEVQMHHPGKGTVIHEQPDRYRLLRAFFPGQGFEVSWKKIGTSEANEASGKRPEEVPHVHAASRAAEPQSPKPRPKNSGGQGDLPL
jgi:hypothetical protein